MDRTVIRRWSVQKFPDPSSCFHTLPEALSIPEMYYLETLAMIYYLGTTAFIILTIICICYQWIIKHYRDNVDFGTTSHYHDNAIWVIRYNHLDNVLLRDNVILAMMYYLDNELLGGIISYYHEQIVCFDNTP